MARGLTLERKMSVGLPGLFIFFAFSARQVFFLFRFSLIYTRTLALLPTYFIADNHGGLQHQGDC